MQEYNYIIRLKEAMKNNYTEEYIDKCIIYAKKLLDKNLPVLFDKHHVDEILKLYSIKRDCYHTFFVRSKKKQRKITAPSKNLKLRQQWILKEILENNKVSDCCHGFVKDRSILTNAKKHSGHKNILNIDIENFFPSITQMMVVKVFEEMGYNQDVSQILSELCCYQGRLPQGAPSSPYLANLILRDMDIKLLEFCEKNEITYTRYADDMSFSSDRDIKKHLEILVKIIESYSFHINDKKTKYYEEPYRKIVTGLIVKQDGVYVPKKFKRTLKQEIYYCKKLGVASHLENTGNNERVAFKEYLYGKAYYVNMVEPKQGQKFLEELDMIEWKY